MSTPTPLAEVARVFFKLGCIAFGGPAAHLAMMEDEVVTKRKWMTREHFLDMMGATNLIPGPNSTEMTMHCGHARAGAAGMWVAGACFIVPAVVTTGLLAWLYVSYGTLPDVEPWVQGIKPAVLAVIAAAVYKLGKKALKSWELGVIGALVVLVCTLGWVNEITALLTAGLLGAGYFTARDRLSTSGIAILPLVMAPAAAKGITTTGVFLSFLKTGAILYGSGYVLFAYLDDELVERGWLTTPELLDAIAMGQFTPGPVLSTATFVGFQLDGIGGALAATAGIFLPSFLFVLLTHRFIVKLRQYPFLSRFLDAVNVAALGVMVAVMITMGQATLADWKGITIAALGAFFTFGPWKLSAMWIIAGGALLGGLLHLV